MPDRATPAGERERPPEPPFRLVIDMNADTWPDMVRRLTRLVEHIEEHGPECREVSGGGGGSHYVNIVRRDVSVEQYHAELEAWFTREKEVARDL